MLKNFVIVLINRWKVIFSDESFSSSTFFNSDICKLLSPEKEVRIFLLHWDRVAYIKDPWFLKLLIFFAASQPWVFFNHYLLVWKSNKCIQYILFAIPFLWCKFGEFGIGSTNNPLTDIFLCSYHLQYLLDVVLIFCKENSCIGHSCKVKG